MLRATALALACLVGAPAIAAESPTYGKLMRRAKKITSK